MIKNYLRVAFRQMGKQKLYSAIKIGGFALGIASCLLIALYIRNELSYDSYYPDTDRIYRVLAVYHDKGKVFRGTAFSPPFARALKDEFPQVELTARLMPYALFSPAGSNEVQPEGKLDNSFEEGFTLADSSLLEMFGLPMVYGDRAHALNEPNSIVISRSKAEKFFPHENPVGKLLYLNNDRTRPRRIGGVMEDFPATSHLHFDYLATLAGNELWPKEQSTWMAQNYDTYVKLRPGADPVKLAAGLKAIQKKYMVPAWLSAGQNEAQKWADSMSFALQPVRGIHLQSSDIGDSFLHGDIRLVWLFGAVAVLILALACINFINLSTARSANRAKEVGLRKVVGSTKSALIRQFLTESLLFSILSFLLALLLAWGLMPFFNQLTGGSLHIPWTAWWLAPLIIGAAVVVGLLAGLYPSFYLSAFQPIRVLKGDVSRGSRNSSLRSVLVVFQFATSIMLIFASLVVYRQMHYILDRQPGFDKDQVLLIQGVHTLKDQVPTFRDELARLPGVKYVSASDYMPIQGSKRNMNTFHIVGKEKESGVGLQIWRVDHNYVPAMGITMKEGRNFSPVIKTDSQAVIINQTLARKLGLKEPLGQQITNGGGSYTVIGVMNDFNFESVKQEIGPLCIVLGRYTTMMAVKADGKDMAQLLGQIKGVWKSFSPHQAIRYDFLDEQFARMYADVGRTGRIFTSFTVLAMIIACLGLFALSAFMAEQRGKEMGIRKVLGATASQVAGLLSKDFLRLVAISILIASPLAWWMMHHWLEDFVYRVPLSAWMLVLAGGMVVLVAMLTISFQAIRAGVANPVKALRSE